MKIVEWKIVEDDNPTVLENNVAQLIAEGYQPFGGIAYAATAYGNKDWYAQAMVKYAPEPRRVIARNAATGEPIYEGDGYLQWHLKPTDDEPKIT